MLYLVCHAFVLGIRDQLIACLSNSRDQVVAFSGCELMAVKGEPHSRLRSAVWSSETLVTGIKAIQAQQDTMMVKTEDEQDAALEKEYKATWLPKPKNGWMMISSFGGKHVWHFRFCKKNPA